MKIIGIILLAIILIGAGVYSYLYLFKQKNSELIIYGNVEIRQVDLAFRVGGRLMEIRVDEGNSVNTNDVLAIIDPDLLQQSLNKAQAMHEAQQAELLRLKNGYRPEEIAQAVAGLNAAKANLINANMTLKRLSTLRKSNATAQKDLDRAIAHQAQMSAEVQVAFEQHNLVTSGYRKENILAQEANVESSQAILQQAKISLADATLYAPQAGIILTRVHEVGAIIQAGQPVYTLSLINPVWIRAYVEEPYLGRLKPEMIVQIFTDSAPNKIYDATIASISSTAEFAPKTVETVNERVNLVYAIRLRMQDPENIMRQGMPITVTIPLN